MTSRSRTLLVPALVTAAAAGALLCGRAGETRERPPGSEAVTEARVLHEVCRYLRLSKSQIALMLPTARAAGRAVEGLAPLRRQVESLADRPEELKKAQAQLKAAQAKIAADLSAYAAPQLARILTREQIALVWRLTGGTPPRYTNAAPSLRDPKWGFARPVLPNSLGYDEFLGGGAAPRVALEPFEGLALPGRMVVQRSGDVLPPEPGAGLRGRDCRGRPAARETLAFRRPFPGARKSRFRSSSSRRTS